MGEDMKSYPIFNRMVGKVVHFNLRGGDEITIRVEKSESDVVIGTSVGTTTGYHYWIDVASIQAFSYAGDLK